MSKIVETKKAMDIATQSYLSECKNSNNYGLINTGISASILKCIPPENQENKQLLKHIAVDLINHI